ncbi:type I secretion C-terminal target domain-containing protein [Undibacterium fentianense]|uniref:Type I secretion C-terminal target domain-containing protein n=1 Tax=Undibacterium fentianense TaxID=2828728 RepID=A0A941IHY3_9BURK|nr:type I secretion C-terminal target domain-containing protein [Undibacterium fentianense]MBR7801420.1 type I secretion C-terminal target domain-containing protein [Undibacterium fentianense]
MAQQNTSQSYNSPLTIRSITPDSYQGRVAVDSNIVITFSEAILAGNGSITIRNSLGEIVFQESINSPNITISGAVLTFNPSTNLAFVSQYSIELSTGIVKTANGVLYQSPNYAIANFSTEFSNIAMNVTGTPGNDTIYGSSKNDVIHGGAGRDKIEANDGDDIVNGGDETSGYFDGDSISGGDGNDILHGNAGSDEIDGGNGDDKLYGDADNDSLNGGSGNDEIYGGSGDDTIDDYAGNNVLRGEDGNDLITSGYLYADNGFSLLDGGAGNDMINAGASDDVQGGDGDDKIRFNARSGYTRVANVDGGNGNDTFNVYAERADNLVLLRGGSGTDTFIIDNYGLSLNSNFTIVDFAAGKNGDKIDLSKIINAFYQFTKNPFDVDGFLRLKQDGQNTLIQTKVGTLTNTNFCTIFTLENITPSQLTGDNFTGGLNPNGSTVGMVLIGTERSEELRGNILDDQISGESGADTIFGDKGNDVLIGGTETSINDADTIYGESGDDLLLGGAGNDSLHGGDGNDTLEGGSGDDYLSDSIGINLIRGQDGNDLIFINSNEGGIFEGGNGNDQFEVNTYGKIQNVSMTGGTGADIFAIRISNVSNIRIKDFSVSDGDLIDLSSLLPLVKENPFGSSAFLKASQDGSNIVILFDDDGAAGSAYAMHPILTIENLNVNLLDGTSFKSGWNPNGSDQGEAIRGTTNDDRLVGRDLNDSIYGSAGNDYINGGKGNDQLSGDEGSDVLVGETGNDTLNGGAGNDDLSGGDGNDLLDGGTGDDHLVDSVGDNILRGGTGNDILISDGANSVADGGDGDDQIMTPGGNDTVIGGTGNDIVMYGGGTTTATKEITSIDLGEGNDRLHFEPTKAESKATVSGGLGIDTYKLGASAYNGVLTISDFQVGPRGDIIDLFDLLNGHYKGGNPFGTAGMLRLVQKGSDAVIEYDYDGQEFSTYGFRPILVLSGIQGSTLIAENFGQGMNPNGGDQGQNVTGTISDDRLIGGILNDRLSGDAGNDTIDGGNGDDQLSGGDGKDRLNGGMGNDVLNGGNGNDILDEQDEIGDNQFFGGDGNDYLKTFGTGLNQLNGGNGDDVLIGGNGTDTLNGDDGDDTIDINFNFGSASRAREIVVNGGNGHDKITFSAGYDMTQIKLTVTGGNGIDTFVVPNMVNNTQLIVTDFTPGAKGDFIDISKQYYQHDKNPFGEVGYARLLQRGQDTVLQIDTDGPDGLRQFQDILTLKNVLSSSLTPANFIGGYAPNGISQGMLRDGDEQNDTIDGTSLNDTLNGGAGNDELNGGFGDDELHGDLGNDILVDNSGDNVFLGGAGDDAIYSNGDGTNNADGGSGNDTFFISGNSGTYSGADGNDTFTITTNHYSYGSVRVLSLNGGSGEDQFTITGSFNQNLKLNVNGGPDADLFTPRNSYSSGTFNILDFDTNVGGDKIDLTAILAEMNFSTERQGNPFANGYLSLQQSDGDTVLIADQDGTGPISNKVILTLKNLNVNALNQSHFVESFDPKGGNIGVEKVGDAQDNRFIGTWTKDTLTGLAGNDYLTGQGGNDLLDGGTGNDTLVGGAGDDQIMGGLGFDTASYSSGLSDFQFTKTETGFKVESKYGGNSGVDNLSGIEYLHFTDINLNLTVKEKAASIASADVKMLIELYVAFFNRTPDADGVAYWIDQFKNGQSIAQISESFYNIGASDQFAALTGFTTSMNNEDFIHTFYRNVLGRKDGADEGGLRYWNNKLMTGESSRSSLAQDILNSAHTFKGNADFGYVADLLDNKYLVGRTLAIDWGISFVENPYERGVSIAAAVTPTNTDYALSLVGVVGKDLNFF